VSFERKQQTAPDGQRRAHEFAAMEAILMKVVGVISATALFLLLGAIVPAFGQEEHQQEAKPEAKPAQHEQEANPAKQQAKPEKQQEAKPARQENEAKSAKKEPEAKPARQESEAKSAKKEPEAKPARQESEAKSATREPQEHGNGTGQQHAQRTPAEEQRQHAVPALRLSARGSGRIPDERFRSNFGREHEFRIGDPTLVGGFSRFAYGGYSFGFIQPWPVGWYYTDDVYVDYIDGAYYLCNPYYPGARISISVVI
jgi:hypothetical protein